MSGELRIRPQIPGADDENPVKAIQIYLRLGFQVVCKLLSYERAV